MPDPGAVPRGVGFPVDVRAAQIPAARMSLQHDRPAGQCAEQEVQCERTRVGTRCVAVPGHLHQVTLGLWKDPSEDLGERGGIRDPRDKSGPRPDRRFAHRHPILAGPHLRPGRWSLVLDGGNTRRLTGPLVLPKSEQPLFEPGENCRMIPRRVE